MIGFVVSVMRGNFEEDEIERIHKDDYVKFIPKVPGEGLMLSELFFPGYNKQHGSIHGEITFEGEAFKNRATLKESIIQNIVQMEVKEKLFENFVLNLDDVIEKSVE
jgi:hypothetical protein